MQALPFFSRCRWQIVAFLLVALPGVAQAFTIGPVPVEVTSASLNLSGSGEIPLGNNWSLVNSDILLRESDTQFSTVDITLDFDDFDPLFAPRPDKLAVTTAVAVSLFPVIELNPSRPQDTYGGTLGTQVTLEAATPLSASRTDQITFHFTGVDPKATLFDLLLASFDFTTIPFTTENIGMTSNPLLLKQHLGQSVGGNPLENDFIEVELVGLSLAGSAFDLGDLLTIDLSDPQLEFAQPQFPRLEIRGRVNDLSQDPRFGPIELLASSPASVRQPGTAWLLLAGGLLFGARKVRVG